MIREHEFNEVDQRIECAPGVVVVQMATKKSGLIARVDDGKTCKQIAKVIAVGDRFEGVYLGKKTVSDPKQSLDVGDTVIIDPTRGFILDGFGWDVVSDTTIRVFGSNGGPGSFVPFQRYAFDEAIMAKSDFKAVGKRITIKLGAVLGEQGGILLTDRSSKRDPICKVVLVGPEVTSVKVGDEIVVSQNAIYEFQGEARNEDLGSIHEDAILFKKGK